MRARRVAAWIAIFGVLIAWLSWLVGGDGGEGPTASGGAHAIATESTGGDGGATVAADEPDDGPEPRQLAGSDTSGVRPPWTLSGIVVDAGAGTPIADAEVVARVGFSRERLYDASLRILGQCRADSKGRFRFALDELRDLSPRAKGVAFLEVRARAPGYKRPWWAECEHWTPDGAGAWVAVPLQRADVLRGRVVDSAGRPVVAATVTAGDDDGRRWARVFTDENGDYELLTHDRDREVPTHLLLASHPIVGYALPTRISEAEVAAGIGPMLVLDQSRAVLRVQVRFTSGAPAADVPVRATWLDSRDVDIDIDWKLDWQLARAFEAHSDERGELIARNVLPGAYAVTTGKAIERVAGFTEPVEILTDGGFGILTVPYARVRFPVVETGGVIFGDANVGVWVWNEPDATQRRADVAAGRPIDAAAKDAAVRHWWTSVRAGHEAWGRPGTFWWFEAVVDSEAPVSDGVYLGHGEHEAAVRLVLTDGR